MPRDAAPRDRKPASRADRALERLRPLRPWWGLLTVSALVLGSAPPKYTARSASSASPIRASARATRRAGDTTVAGITRPRSTQ